MVLPIADGLPTRRMPIVTWTLILANCVILLWETMLGHESIDALRYGFVPLFFFHGLPPGYDIGAVPSWASLFTYAFIHGGFLHLGGNMLFLWIFGNNVEDVLGRFRFIVFYLIAAAAGALLEGVVSTASTAPLVGASGAIAGVLAAYLRLFPRQRVIVLIGWFPVPLPAFIVIGIWLAFQFVDGFSGAASAASVAWLAHVGGFVAGFLLVKRFQPKTTAGPWG